jgi:hypothetical protein
MTLPTLNNSVPTVCKLLRTKTAFGSFAETAAPPWQTGESTTAAFWCLATMQSAGPDDFYAHPHQCHAGRSCFKSPEE